MKGPYAGSENSELWNEALKEIAQQISQKLLSEGAENGKRTWNKLAKSLGKSPANGSDEPLGVIESILCQMSSSEGCIWGR